MGLFGSSKNKSSQSSVNQNWVYSPNNTPTFNYSSPEATGANLKLTSSSDQDNTIKQLAEQLLKDEFGITASVGVGVAGGSGSGGSATSSEGPESMGFSPKPDDTFLEGFSGFNPLWVVGAIISIFIFKKVM
jgi:hypothetical protein